MEEIEKFLVDHGGSGGPCCLTFEQIRHAADKHRRGLRVVEAARDVEAQLRRVCAYDTPEILVLRRALAEFDGPEFEDGSLK